MVGNVTIPGLTSAVTASLSAAAVTGLLRHRLGFRGLVLTDSLSAIAVQDARYAMPQAAAQAIEAGVDMVLFNSAASAVTASAAIAGISTAALRTSCRSAGLTMPSSMFLASRTNHSAQRRAGRCGGFGEQRWSEHRFNVVVAGKMAKFGKHQQPRAFLAGTSATGSSPRGTPSSGVNYQRPK